MSRENRRSRWDGYFWLDERLKVTPPIIVGIVLVRNEDRFLGQVLWNVRRFCDRMIIADDRSRDRTEQIARQFCVDHPHAVYHRIDDPARSHDLIKPYAGRKVWLFGVDGDELYEADRLAALRERLLSGSYDHCWMLLGNALNCFELDRTNNTARGYLAPPCRSMTKLYNFNAIVSWEGDCTERLHGGQPLFKPGFGPEMRCDLYQEVSWEASIFRCLHLCFLPRTSREKKRGGQLTIRKNIADRVSEDLITRIGSEIRRCLGFQELSPLKREKYMRGEPVKKTIGLFLKPHVD
jgi:hypothetical protein